MRGSLASARETVVIARPVASATVRSVAFERRAGFTNLIQFAAPIQVHTQGYSWSSMRHNHNRLGQARFEDGARLPYLAHYNLGLSLGFSLLNLSGRWRQTGLPLRTALLSGFAGCRHGSSRSTVTGHSARHCWASTLMRCNQISVDCVRVIQVWRQIEFHGRLPQISSIADCTRSGSRSASVRQ